MVTPEDAARLLGTSPRAIYRLVESGGLHFIEIDSGGLLVCVNSLPQT
jgi:excisionase family DNA binding protein